jgi:hypothetical protein
MRLVFHAIFLVAAVPAIGCGSFHTELARSAPSEVIPAELAPNAARVVFIRPTGFAGAMRIDIIDDNGAYIGTSLPMSYFHVELEPGPHTFIGWGTTTAPLWAVLEAGNEYYGR